MQESFGQAESVEKPPMWIRFFESGKYGIGGSVEGPFVFWVRLIRNIFDMQSRLKSVWHIMWNDPISGPISDQRKLDQNQTNTIQFQCIISGYFGPLNSHKRELNLFRQPQKFRFNFKQISRPHQRGQQCWKRGPHTKASPNCGSSARQRFRAEWFQLTKKTNSPDNLPNAFRQKRNSRRRRKKKSRGKENYAKGKVSRRRRLSQSFPWLPLPLARINPQSNCERESKSSKSTRIMHFLTVNKNKVSSSRSLSWSYAHSKGTQKERKMPKDMDIQIEVGRNQCASTKIYSAYNLIKQIEESHKAKIAEENQTHRGQP